MHRVGVWLQPRRYPEEERDIMREDEIAALPTEEERRREVSIHNLPLFTRFLYASAHAHMCFSVCLTA